MRAQTTNPVWKRNRNLHARLLLEQLRAGRLAEPFERPPPDGPLRTLGAWATAPYLSRCRCALPEPRHRMLAGCGGRMHGPRVTPDLLTLLRQDVLSVQVSRA